MVDKSYCTEKIQFMKAEILTIKDLLVTEPSFRKGELSKVFAAIDGKEEILKKDAETSTRYRKAGNFKLKKKDHTLDEHLEIWNYYTKSIAYAPKDSLELTQGYYNRSSYFFHIKKYQESIDDADKAFALKNFDDDLKLKLDRLKSKSLIIQIRKMVYAEDKDKNAKAIPETCIEIFNKNDKIPCASDALEINYHKKYGRHIVAKKDISPGELLVKEKFYSQFFFGDNQSHCTCCCKLAYSSIPCDSCAYAMFCSEKCKKKSWDDYHMIECTIINNEVDSIELLSKYLEEVDNCDDPCRIGTTEGKYRSDHWSSILTLSTLLSKIRQIDLTKVSFYSTAFTYWIGTGTNFFSKTIKSSKDFLDNDDALFFAALLSRLQHIILVNNYAISEMYHENELKSWNPIEKYDAKCVECGVGIAALSSLFNYSCLPDVASSVNDCGEIFFVALRPIKKGSQIFASNGNIAMACERSVRIEKNDKLHGFVCECRACKENWPIHDADNESNTDNNCTVPLDSLGDFKRSIHEDWLVIERLMHNDQSRYKKTYSAYKKAYAVYMAIYNKWYRIQSCCDDDRD